MEKIIADTKNSVILSVQNMVDSLIICLIFSTLKLPNNPWFCNFYNDFLSETQV